MNLTFAVTTYNRYEMLIESFAGIIEHPSIDEVLIMDDCSEDTYWNKIKELPKFHPKIKVVRQLQNRGMSVNKKDAVFHSKNEWVILADSDNVFRMDYLEAIDGQMKRDNIEMQAELSHPTYPLYLPSFAKPEFDYRKYNSHTWGGVKMPPIKDNTCNMALNTCNYVVHRESYLEVWEENKEIGASDTIWFSYLWLKSGRLMSVVKDMHYYHRVHSESGFLKDASNNMKKAEEIKKMIMDL